MQAIDCTKLLMCGTHAVLLNSCMHTSLHKHLLLASMYVCMYFNFYPGMPLQLKYAGLPGGPGHRHIH